MKSPRLDRAMRQQHPSLWRAVYLDIVTLVVAGVGYGFMRVPPTFSLIPVAPIGWAMLVCAVMLWHGWRSSPSWYSRALAFAAGLWGFLSLSVFGSVIQGYLNDTLAPSLGSAAALGFVACQYLIQAGEPHTNPVSEAMHK